MIDLGNGRAHAHHAHCGRAAIGHEVVLQDGVNADRTAGDNLAAELSLRAGGLVVPGIAGGQTGQASAARIGSQQGCIGLIVGSVHHDIAARRGIAVQAGDGLVLDHGDGDAAAQGDTPGYRRANGNGIGIGLVVGGHVDLLTGCQRGASGYVRRRRAVGRRTSQIVAQLDAATFGIGLGRRGAALAAHLVAGGAGGGQFPGLAD